MKKYKDIGIYDFSDYAEEVTGDDLIKINGGTSACAGDRPSSSSAPSSSGSGTGGVGSSKSSGSGASGAGGSGSSGTGGTTGGSPTGSGTGSGCGACGSGYNPSSPSGPTQPSTPDVPEEIKSNPQAYAYYMALQEQAKAEGNPDKYKGYNVLGSENSSLFADSFNNNSELKSLRQFSVGVRGSLVIGGSLSVGIVVNPNNYWDSGISRTIGVGTGVEAGINLPFSKPLSTILENAISGLSSTIDLTNPKSTKDIEGISNTAYVSAFLGLSHDLDKNQIKGVEVLNVGGGVYREKTSVLTIGEVAEGIYNTGAFFANTMYKFAGVNKSINYIELDGQ